MASQFRITPTWHKPGYHLHEFGEDNVWKSAQFYPTKEKAQKALDEMAVEISESTTKRSN